MTTTNTTRPFGVRCAIPARPTTAQDIAPPLALCPDRQISVLETGQPYVHTPSMGTSIQTTTQTREDGQVWSDDEGTDSD
jgi:putative ATP-grasp target RiPP